jgi:hypothetical protein
MFKRSGRIRSAALGLAATTLAVGGISVLSMTSAGATAINVVPTPECGRVVEWTVSNPTDFPLAVTDGDLPPQDIAPHASTSVTVDYSETPGDIGYFTVIGHFYNVVSDGFYPPDENGNLPWVEGQQVTLNNDVCETPTTQPPTTQPPTTQPPVTQPPTTTPPSLAPTTVTSPTTTPTSPPTQPPSSEVPETTVGDDSQVSPEQVVSDEPTETGGLAFTGADTTTLTAVGVMLVAFGVALLRLRRGARLQ